MAFPTFAVWAVTYGKFYNRDEVATQEAVYNANVAKMQEHDAQNASWTMDVNQFSNLSPAEFQDQFLGHASHKSDFNAFLGQHQWEGELLPVSVNWATASAVSPVEDQGQCGSCWAFSTTGSLEGALKLVTGHLLSLPEQQLVDCATLINRDCNGGSMDFGFRFAKDHDSCLEDS